MGQRLTVDHFVLKDGRTYRTQRAYKDVLRACKSLADEVSLQDLDLQAMKFPSPNGVSRKTMQPSS